jgi:hypothetical protein
MILSRKPNVTAQCLKISNSSWKANDEGDIILRLSKLLRKQKATHEPKHMPFYGNIISITPYSAENPWQSSRIMKLNSAVLCSVTRCE